MPAFIIDITLSDADAQGVDAVRKALRAVYPEASIENWQSPADKHFWRVLAHEETPSFSAALDATSAKVLAVRELLRVADDESLGVQLALRDGRYDVFETIPTVLPVKESAGKRQGHTSSRHIGDRALGLMALALVVSEAVP